MKKAAFIVVFLVASRASLLANGFITFSNFTTAMMDNKGVLDSSYSVGLFLGNQIGNIAAVPIATTTIFGAGTPQDPATGLFQYSGSDVDLGPSTAAGQTTVLTVKAWKGETSYATALSRGEVSFTSLPLGGVNPNPPPPALTAPTLDNMPVLHIIIPEPATFALAIAGLGALAIHRHRKPTRILK